MKQLLVFIIGYIISFITTNDYMLSGIIASGFIIIISLFNQLSPYNKVWWIILKGWHYSIGSIITIIYPLWRIVNLKKTLNISFYIIFNDYGNDLSWNKIVGLSFLRVHKNSYRLAWRPYDNDKYELCEYQYINGKRHIGKKVLIEYGDNVQVYWGILGYTVKNDYKILFSKSIIKKYGWLLLPYWGGKNKAPVTMRMKMIIKNK